DQDRSGWSTLTPARPPKTGEGSAESVPSPRASSPQSHHGDSNGDQEHRPTKEPLHGGVGRRIQRRAPRHHSRAPRFERQRSVVHLREGAQNERNGERRHGAGAPPQGPPDAKAAAALRLQNLARPPPEPG